MFLRMLPVAGCAPGAGRCGRRGVRPWAGNVPGPGRGHPHSEAMGGGVMRQGGTSAGRVHSPRGELGEGDQDVQRPEGWDTADASVVFPSGGGSELSTSRDAERKGNRRGVSGASAGDSAAPATTGGEGRRGTGPRTWSGSKIGPLDKQACSATPGRASRAGHLRLTGSRAHPGGPRG